MLDFGLFEVRTDIFILFMSVLTLILQVLLCFGIEKLWIRLLPSCLLFSVTAVFAVLVFASDGWDSIGFLLLALWAALLLVASGLGWAIWGAIRLAKKHLEAKQRKED